MGACYDARAGGFYHTEMAAHRRRIIEQALRAVQGNRVQAARDLGLQPTYLFRLIRQIGIDVPSAHEYSRGWPKGKRRT